MPDMYQSSEGLQQSLDDALVKIKQGTHGSRADVI